LLAAPNLFGFAEVGGAAVWVPRVVGVIVLLQSICTRYELGLVKMLPMKMHLMNDYVASIFLAASPVALRLREWPLESVDAAPRCRHSRLRGDADDGERAAHRCGDPIGHRSAEV
jgi:hypothetical protein